MKLRNVCATASLRIGVHLGDIMEKADGKVYGTGINVAARLESLAAPGCITVSDAVREAVAGKLVANFVDLGLQSFKNIPEPMRAFGAPKQAMMCRRAGPFRHASVSDVPNTAAAIAMRR